MKNLYKIFFVTIFSIFVSKSFAQKTMTIYVNSLQISGMSTDCDGSGDEDPRWYFTNNYQSNDPCYEHSQTNNGTVDYGKNGSGDIISSITRDCNSLFPTDYNVRCRSCENDGTSCWTFSSCDGAEADFSSGNINLATLAASSNGDYYYPSSTTWYSGSGGCGATYRFRLRINISGSENTSAPGSALARDNICNAQDLGTLNPSATLNGTGGNNGSYTREAAGYISEPGGQDNTMWYRVTIGNPAPAKIAFNTDAGGACTPWSKAYIQNTALTCPFNRCTSSNPFNNIAEVADGGLDGYEEINCPTPGSVYYMQADITGLCSTGDIQNPYFQGFATAAPDDICNALQIGAVGGIAINTFAETATRLSNQCATLNTGGRNDPVNAEGNDATVWFKFNTPSAATAAADYYIEVRDPNGFPTFGGIEFEVYKLTGTACASTPGLSYVGQYDPFGCDDEGGANFCLDPSSTYYIMVDAESSTPCSGGDRGEFRIRVTGNNRLKAPNLCTDVSGTYDLGTLTGGGTLGGTSNPNRWNNFCANASGDPNPGWTLDNNIRQSVWFKFNSGTAGRNITIDGYSDPNDYGDEIDMKLALYKGPCNSLTYIDRDYDPDPGLGTCLGSNGGLCAETMEAKYCLEQNTDYYILVDGSGLNTEGYFGLRVKDNGPYPVNDLICGAKNVTVQTAYTYNSDASLNNETNVKGTNCYEPNPNWTAEVCQDNDAAVWYKIGQVPGRTIVVDANSLSGDNVNIEMALYSTTTNSCAATLTEVQKEFNITSFDEDAYFNCLNPNLYYWLMVDGGDVDPTCLGITGALEEGNFSLRFWFPEEGEITGCAAENLGTVPTGGSITIQNLSNICGASSITNFPAPSSFTFDKAVVYKFTTPAAPGYTDASVKIEAFTNPYYPFSSGGNMDPTFLLAGDEIDLQLALYSSGACNSSHFVVGSNYDVTVGTNVRTGSDESLIVNCLLPSTEYYLVVDGGVNTNGYYDLKISDYGKHTTNDFLCNAVDITATNSAPWTNCNSNTAVTLTAQNNYCATTNNDIPSSLGLRPTAWSEMNAPVWYKFKAPKSGKLKIEAINTVADAIPPFDEPEISAQLAVFFLPGGYQGTCANLSTEKERLQYIGSNHDGGIDSPLSLHDEEYTIECLMPDSIYYLLVDGSSELDCPTCVRGEFYLKLTADPRDRPSTNDALCDAIDLGTPVMGTTIVDTKVSPASGAGTNPSPTTGYPASSPATLHGSPRTGNTGTCMRAENNFCAGTANEPGVSGGTFLTDFSPDATVWYSFTAPTTGEVIIDAYNDPDSRGDQIDLQLAVYESSDGTCSGTMVPIKAEYNIGFFDETMRVQCLNPGQKYWIMVDGSGLNTYGYFELQVQAVTATLSAPANDDICNATTVTYPASVGSTTTLNNQTNRCATIQTIYSEPTTFTKDADVWYKFTTPNTAAPHAVEVTVTSGLPWPFGDAMDPQIALYKMNPTTGPCATSFTLVDDDYSALGLPFIETFEFHCLEQNTTYYLMVDGSGLNEQGNFKLDVKRITPHPLAGNDNICNVINAGTGSLGTLGSTTGNKVGNTTTNWHNFCSSVESGESALMTDGNYTLDQTVWFKFRTPSTANNIDVEIRALNDPNNVGDQIDLQMLLVQGNPGCSPTNFTSLSPIESVDPLLTFDATMNVCLPPNTDFYINVDGSGLNKQGYFTLEIENKGLTSAPSNDNICNAKVLPSGGTITGSYSGYTNDNNNCATLEANEKQQTAGSIQRSVWYKFVAPTSADVSIEVKGNSFVPFTQNYFLPDVTIWEVNDGTFVSPSTTIAGCATPSAAQWNKLEYNDYQVIPNSLANGLYPTVVLTPLCLKPNYTYYVQVDGVAGIGLDGYFSIQIKNNQSSYTGPGNNEASGATAVPISSASCQLSNGVWQGAYSFGSNPTWSNPSLIGITTAGPLPVCTQNCGDVWYKFQMPAACGNNTKSFIKIEGDDEFNLDLDGYPELAIAAYNGGQTTSTANLSYMKCSIGGTGVDPDFSIAANPGDWIYLQIWDLAGNEQGKTFKLCVSEQKSADDCVDATNMTLDVPYCWSVESHTGEAPSSAVPGSGLSTCFGSGVPQHSSYFKFTTDAATNFCDDYYIYVNTTALAKLLPSGADHACLAGVTSSVSLNMALWELKSTGTVCTPGVANVVQEDCITWNDCGGGSFGANTTGPHGNGGLVQDTIWYNLASGQELKPNTTYYIVLDYNIDNIFYENRVVLDGTITVGRRCKGRVWEYTTEPLVTTSNYCETRDGWQHYYDDKGTPATADDRYVFSLYPNGNNIKGTAKIYLNNNYYSFLDIPNRFAEYVMRRRWDFVLSPGFNTIDPSKPVKVRFYYQNAEKQEIITAAQNFATNYGVFYEDFEWFKSANGHEFNVVTDVNPAVISVGPNGYSETGCLSLWDASGTYVGLPGVTRCITKIITDWDDNNSYHQWCNGVHFSEYNGLTGFSGGTGGSGASPFDASPLPVELISFTGYNDGDKNVLNWTTVSESNTLKFEIQRNSTGAGGAFNYIGEKAAAGNSTQVLNYTIDDLSPLQGNNYYRLKIIDKDGSFSYSQTIMINVSTVVEYKDVITKIFPNPTNHMLYVDYQSASNSTVILKVFDAIGQEISNSKMTVVRGNQLLHLDVSDFADGVYIINIQNENDGKILQAKFVKD